MSSCVFQVLLFCCSCEKVLWCEVQKIDLNLFTLGVWSFFSFLLNLLVIRWNPFVCESEEQPVSAIHLEAHLVNVKESVCVWSLFCALYTFSLVNLV